MHERTQDMEREELADKEELANKLAKAWARYVVLFGEPPHGTVQQPAAMLALIGEHDV